MLAKTKKSYFLSFILGLLLVPGLQPRNLYASTACVELVQDIVSRNHGQIQKKRSPYGYGEMITVDFSANTTKTLDDEPRMRMVTYNLYNLHDFIEKKGRGRGKPNQKPVHQLEGIAKAIRDMDNPEIIAVQEAGDLEYQQHFLDQYLNGDYTALSMEGNDGRGVRVAYWVRNDLPVKVNVHSFREWEASYQGEDLPIFSRDFLVAEVINPDTDETLFYTGAVHHKSMRNDSAFPDDPGGRMRRQAQVDASLDIRDMILEKHNGLRPPFLVMGDFNADFNKAAENELRRFFDDGFMNSLFFNCEGNCETFHKQTLVQSQSGQRPEEFFESDIAPFSHMGRYKREGDDKARRQLDLLDGILIYQPDYLNRVIISSHIHQYLDEYGELRMYQSQFEEEGWGIKILNQNIPISYKHRDMNPSDHNPIYADLDLQALLGNRQ